MHPPRAVIPYLALIFGILTLAFSGIFVHWSEAPGVVTVFYRLVIAIVLLAPLVLWRARNLGLLRVNTGRPARLLLYPFAGGIFTALDLGSWSTAMAYTSIANATLLNNIAPLWVALFASVVWRERLRKGLWVGLALTLAGAVVVLGSDLLRHPQLGLGDGIALVSSLFWAGYYLVTQRGRTFFDTLVYLWLMEIGAAVSLLIFCLVTAQPMTGYPTSTWLAILAAALGPQITGHFLLAYALGHLPASVVSPTMISQPVFTALLAVPLAGQAISPAQALGGTVVLAGIYLVNISRSQPAPAPASAIIDTS
jgi:drug/metabolite transporter (DMT)-like permease